MKHLLILYSLWGMIVFTILAPSCPDAKTAQDYVLLGEHNIAEGDYVKATDNFSKAIKKDTVSFTAYYKRAAAWEQLDSLQNAIEDYDKLLSLPSITVDQKGELLFLRGNMYFLSLKDTLACNDWKHARDMIQ